MKWSPAQPQTVLIAAFGIMLYLWFAFRQVPHAFRYGVAAIIAMLHDVLVTIGAAALFGKMFGWQVDSLYLTALLTVIGFSVHDTIVVFDRVRENLIRMRGEPFDKVVNFSIIQTLNRSINTQLTVIFTLLALILFGGVTIRHFVTIMLIGLLSGTYSSIFNASQILVVWEYKEWRTWFRRKPKSAQARCVSNDQCSKRADQPIGSFCFPAKRVEFKHHVSFVTHHDLSRRSTHSSQKYPGYVRGLVIVRRAINIESPIDEVATHVAGCAESRSASGPIWKRPSAHPNIAAWREAYRAFGAKPSEYPSSIEALVKRVRRGDDVPYINTLAAICNSVSLRYLVPIGGHAIDVMPPDGDIALRLRAR